MSYKLNADALVLQLAGASVQGHVHLPGNGLPVVKQVEPLFPAVLVPDVGHFSVLLVIEQDVNVSIVPKRKTEEALQIQKKEVFKETLSQRWADSQMDVDRLFSVCQSLPRVGTPRAM